VRGGACVASTWHGHHAKALWEVGGEGTPREPAARRGEARRQAAQPLPTHTRLAPPRVPPAAHVAQQHACQSHGSLGGSLRGGRGQLRGGLSLLPSRLRLTGECGPLLAQPRQLRRLARQLRGRGQFVCCTAVRGGCEAVEGKGAGGSGREGRLGMAAEESRAQRGPPPGATRVAAGMRTWPM
jgi:hypothetical protein